ncbi:Asp-tRNA(Asn)/Glu-tRNA(Gln) amidotransferase GatCAB subunit C [Candidatus Roizmanbacteria bacterium CG_4_10_14_0_2_um_filter_39_13]|uniref:Asp-tRNA(Asn)/Glu-tRNA(Gln) amidotransferase GatCAB subunit C n=1 Tax=Candidatus Roizmanbacteria bacterium CG_4_10_14_0_2_um_filter_39_13 TaxID=1974825 RepID=A0A2M7U1K1_9BACT|nr:MAG: Asp-tRNA(Asn)/Glu-tRNA(Gln) amidotransferase GatCAB subunit C [Candidatus Roizmanbacteria bacterium CG_4_10_14_0_2_um_filter_39_13]
MSKTVDLTKEDILHIAKLANLPISENDIEKYQKDLSETISYVENLDELDISKTKASSHTTDLQNVYFEDGTEETRKLTQKQATQNAKNIKNGQFVVKRLI